MPVPEDFYEATLIWKAGTGPKEMTSALGLIDVSVGGPRTPTQVADAVFTAITATGAPCAAGGMIDDWSFLGVSVAMGTSTGDLLGQHLATVVGTVTDNTPACNSAVLLTKNTASGGRRNRGRMFIPPIFLNEGAVDTSGNIAGSSVIAHQTKWDFFLTGLGTAHLEPVLFHQGAGAPSPTAITSLTVESLCATQRRRMRN